MLYLVYKKVAYLPLELPARSLVLKLGAKIIYKTFKKKKNAIGKHLTWSSMGPVYVLPLCKREDEFHYMYVPTTCRFIPAL